MKIPDLWKKKHDLLDALSGIDPDADPNMADFLQPDVEARPAIVVLPRDFKSVMWRNIVPIIRQGRKFGIEYPALMPTEARQGVLNQLRAELSYAIVLDEGEGQRRQRFDYDKNSKEFIDVWRVGIVLGDPGFGIPNEVIDSRQAEWVAAARAFRQRADALLQEVLRSYNISLDTLPHLGSMAVAPGGAAHGHGIIGHELNGQWNIQFQKGALFLTHLKNGQEVRVSMYHREVGGVLHGFGFSRWIKTTPEWSDLALFLRDDYFDARRVIARLYEAGCWQAVPRNTDLILLGTKALTAKLL